MGISYHQLTHLKPKQVIKLFKIFNICSIAAKGFIMFSIEYFSTAYFAIVGIAGIFNYVSFNVFSQMANYIYDMYPQFKRSTVKSTTMLTSYLLLLLWPYAIFTIVAFVPCLFFKRQLTAWMRKVSIQSRWGNV